MSDETDLVEQAVAAVVSAVQSGDREAISRTLDGVAPLEVGDVVAELALWIDQLAGDLGTIEESNVRLPPNGIAVINAAKGTDLVALAQAIGSDDVQKTLTTMFVVVAALKDARESSPAAD